MNLKVKCTQCGCDDLEIVDFPYNAELSVVRTGIAGESYEYALDENVYATTYICTKCGHFEFFDPEMARIILEVREENAKRQKEIEVVEKEIANNESEIKEIKQQIDLIDVQLDDLDITIRQSNQLQERKQELIKKVDFLNNGNQNLFKKLNKLKESEE